MRRLPAEPALGVDLFVHLGEHLEVGNKGLAPAVWDEGMVVSDIQEQPVALATGVQVHSLPAFDPVQLLPGQPRRVRRTLNL